MIDPVVKEQIFTDLEALSIRKQRRAAKMVHSLRDVPGSPLPAGTPVKDLMPLFGSIDAESVREMREAIKVCEQVDLSEW